ncbi:MAG: hypothetical protein EOO15_22195 [Chitinophagaceae bacterium]|nr:MAG: hypothetical protein EOO15_22195 [Chitinophagaceae bacterium]
MVPYVLRTPVRLTAGVRLLVQEAFNPLNEQHVLAGREAICHTATSLRSGALPFLEGVRKLAALRFQASVSGSDKDFMPFVAVDSETDHLPSQSALAYCSNEWLVKCEAEMKEVIALHGPAIFAACDKLIQRFSP